MDKLIFTFFILTSFYSFSCSDLALISGQNQTVCLNDSVTLGGSPTAQWLGSGNPTLNFQWFDENNSLIDSVSNPSVVITEPQTFMLVVDDGNGCSDTAYVNFTTYISGITLSMNGFGGPGYSTTTINGEIVYRYCSTNLLDGGFQFEDDSLFTYPIGTSMMAVWGDGDTNTYLFDGMAQIMSHIYTTGNYDFQYTVNLPNGCSYTEIFTVFVGSSPPALTVSGTGTAFCVPGLYDINISASSSPPNTQYVISVNDGTDSTFNGLPSNPFVFQHLFTNSSCGVTSIINGQSYPNQYSITVTSSNACNTNGTFAAFGPIVVSEETEALFTASDTEVCVDHVVTFTDITEPGLNVFTTSCDSSNSFYWEISPNANYTVQPGSQLGSDAGSSNFYFWQNGSEQLDVSFDAPGIYDITLFSANGCGIDSMTQQICVLPQPTVDFSISDSLFCTAQVVNVDNNSTGNACGYSFESTWDIDYINDLNCSPNTGFFYINNTNNTSLEPEIDFVGPGFYAVNLTVGYPGNIAGCLNPEQTDTIQVNAPPEINVITSNDTICEGENISFTASVNNCYDFSTVYNWNFGGGSDVLVSGLNSLDPTVIYNTSGVFSYGLQASNSCGVVNIVDSVIVNQDVLVDAGQNQSTCLNSAVTISGSITGPISSGVWTADVPGGSFVDPFSLSTTYTPPANYIGQISLSLTSDDPVGACLPSSDNLVLTVSDAAQITAMPDLTICENESVSLSASIQGAASLAFWSDNNSSGQFSNQDQVLGTANYSVPSGLTQVWLYVQTDVPSAECPAAIDSVLISIIDLPIINPLSNQTICNGELTQSVAFSGTGTQYSWQNTDATIGLGGNGVGDIASFSAINTGQSTLISSVTVIPEYVVGGLTCAGTPTTFDYILNPTPTLAPVSDQTLCSGEVTNQVDFTSLPGTSYSWANSNTQSGLQAAGSGSLLPFTSTNSTQQPISSAISVTPSLSGCAGSTLNFSITVNPIPVIDPISSIDTCSDLLVNIPFSGSGTAYNWTNDNSSTGLTSSGSGDILFTTSNSGVQSLSSTISVEPVFTSNSVSCAGNIETFTISVQPIPYVNSIVDQELCNNEQTQLVLFSSAVSGTSFSWSNSNTQIGLSSNGTIEIPSFTAINTSNSVLSSTVTVSPTANGCVGPDSSFQFIVNPTPTISNNLLSDTLCSGDLSNEVIWSSNAVGTTYSWTGIVISGSLTGVNLSGTGNLPQMNLVNSGTSPAVLVYTVTPEFNGCFGQAVTYTFVVNPVPTLSPITSQDICGGIAFTTPAFLSTVSNTTYSWSLDQPSAVPSTLTGYPVNGVGDLQGQIINNSGSVAYTLNYSILPNAAGCVGVVEQFSLTVNPAPVVQFDIPDQVICSGDATSLVTLTSSTPGATFDWTVTSQPSSITGVSTTQGTTSIPAMTLSNGLSSVETLVITATATTSGGSACPGAPTDYTININPTPTINSVSNQTVCNGAQTQLVNFSGTATQYSWQNADASIGLNSNGVGDIASFSAINTGQSVLNSSITVTPEFAVNGVTCSGTPISFDYIIEPTPIMNNVADQTLCAGENTVQVDFSGVAGGNYNWINDNPQTGLPVSGTESILPFSTSNSGQQAISSLVTVTPILNGCVGLSENFSITVNPIPVLNPISSIDTCSDLLVNIPFSGSGTAYNWTNDNSSTGLTSSGSGDISFTTSNSGVQSLSSTISVEPVFTSNSVSCAGNIETFTISVQPIPYVNSIVDQELCNNEQTQLVLFSSAVSGTSFSWSNSNTQIGLSSNGTIEIPSFTAINTSNSVLSSTVTVSPTANGCVGPDSSFQFIVNPTPTISNNLLSDTLCSGDLSNEVIWSSNAVGTTYSWTGIVISGSLTGVNLSGTGNLPQMNLVNSGTSPAVLVYTVTPEFNGCFGQAVTYTFVVNPVPTLSPITSQDICGGIAFTTPAFLSTVSNTTYSWSLDQPSAVPSTLTGYPVNGVGDLQGQIINNSGSVAYTLNYSILPNAAGCVGVVEQFSLTVNPAPVVQFDIPDQVICSGDATSLVTLTSSTPGATFDWTVTSQPSSITGVSTTQGTTSIPAMTLSNGLSSVETLVITATATTSGGSACPGAPTDYTININPTPTINSVSNQTVCNGAQTQLVNFSGTATQYSWQNADASIGLNSNGVGDIASFSAINTGQSVLNSSITVTPEFAVNGVTCSGTPISFDYIVNPTPVVNAQSNIEFCDGEQTVAINFSGTGTNYAWTTTNSTIGISLSGSNFIDPFVAQNVTNQTQTSTVSVTPEANGCFGLVSTFDFIVYQETMVDFISDTVYCAGEQVALFNISGSGTSYTWVNDNPAIGLASSGAGNLPSFTALNSTNSPLDAFITITPQFNGNGINCEGVSRIFKITVNPTPVLNSVVDQTICNGASTQPVQFTGVNTSDFEWSNSNVSIGLGLNGTGNISSFSAVNSTAIQQVATIIVSPLLDLNGKTCVGQDESFSFVVNPSPSVTPIVDLVYCDGDFIPTIAISGNATSFDWVAGTIETGVQNSGSGNVSSFTALNNSSQPVSDLITITPNFNSSGLTCPGVTSSFSITVNPSPQVNPISSEVLCANSSTSAVLFSGNASSFSWTNTNDQIGLGLSGTGDIPSFTVTNPTQTPLVSQITVIPEYTSSSLTCSGSPETYTIEVLPEVTINPISDITECSGANVGPISFSGTATDYAWTSSNTTIGLPSNGSGNIPVFSYSNQTSSTAVSTIAVTPSYTSSALTCMGQTENFDIAFLPLPTVNAINDSTYCNGESSASLSFTGLATQFNWVNDNNQIGLSSSGTNTINTFTTINSGNVPNNALISVTPIYTDYNLTCLGSAEEFSITVNPAPSIDPISDIVICNQEQLASVVITGTATNFEWINDNTSIGLPGLGNGNITSFTAVNNSTAPVSANFSVSSSFNSNGALCPGATEIFTITVNPTPVVSPISDQVICSGASSLPVNFMGTASAYNWSNNTPSIGLPVSGTGDISSFTTINAGSTNVTGVITVTPTALQCDGIPETFSYTINSIPTLDPLSSVELCAGEIQSALQPSGSFSTLNWVNNNTTIGLPNSGNTSIPSFTVVNNSNSTVNSALVTLTPLNTNLGVQCAGTSQDLAISVNPIPQNDILTDVEVCNGLNTPLISFSGSGTYYEWSNNNTTIGLNANGTGDILPFSGLNNQNTDNISTLSVTPVYQSNSGLVCEGSSDDFQIIVHPSPALSNLVDTATCNNDVLNIPLSTTIPASVSWIATDNAAVSGESIFTQNTALIDNTLSNNSPNIEVVNYEINSSSIPFGCPGATEFLDVSIIPDVMMTSTTNIEICSGVAASVFLTANVPSTFTWFATDNPNVTGESAVVSNGNLINDILINTSTVPQIVVYSVLPTSVQGACAGPAQTVTVIVNPPVELISPTFTEICSGENVNLNLVANSNVNFNWFAQSSVPVTGESIAVQTGNVVNDQLVNTTTQAESVFYTVVATTQTNGCSSPSTNIEVLVNPLPVVQPFTAQICSNESLSISLSASSPSTFEWFALDNQAIFGESQTSQFTSLVNDQLENTSAVNQTVTYLVQATSAKGCVGLVSNNTITVYPTPSVDFTVLNPVLCDNSPILFQNNSDVGLDFLWDFGDLNSSTAFEPNYTYNNFGTFGVTLTGTNPLTGCINSAAQDVTMQESPPAALAVNTTLGCIPGEFVFTDLNNTAGTNVLWEFGDGESSVQPNQVDHSYDEADCYTITFTVTNQIGCSNTTVYTDLLCTYDNPIAEFSIEDTTVFSSDEPLSFTNTSQNAVTYLWEFGDGLTSSAENPIHVFDSDSASYTIILNAYNAAGCVDQFALRITPERLFYVPNTFTPNGDASNAIFSPVLTSGYDKESYHLIVYNRWGEIMFESYNPEVGWDGTYGKDSNTPCKDGTYIWQIRLKSLESEEAEVFTGHVNLLR